MTTRRRVVLFVAVCTVAAVAAAAAVLLARHRREQEIAQALPLDVAADAFSAAPLGTDELLFQNTAINENYGQLATVPRDDPSGPRTIRGLSCERVHFRSGRGVCLHADRGVFTSYEAIIFDDQLHELHHVGLSGEPSRTKVAPSGQRAAATVFVTGHSYAQTGFSTQTVFIDLAAGAIVADLETDFTVHRDGENWREVDFNFWGVTFVDDDAFYATLGTGGKTYRVRGSFSARTLDVVTGDVECPSLSPDGTRIAFKQRISQSAGPVEWGLAVLDLGTLAVTPLPESRSVDDQVEWLDDRRLAYALPATSNSAEQDVWTLPADGSGAPQLLVTRAASMTTLGG